MNLSSLLALVSTAKPPADDEYEAEVGRRRGIRKKAEQAVTGEKAAKANIQPSWGETAATEAATLVDLHNLANRLRQNPNYAGSPVIGGLENFIEPFAGKSIRNLTGLNWPTKGQAGYWTDVAAKTNELLRRMSGAAVTESELERTMRTEPQVGQSVSENLSRFQRRATDAARKVDSAVAALRANGIPEATIKNMLPPGAIDLAARYRSGAAVATQPRKKKLGI